MEKMDNKYLKIFKNYVETANQLSEKNQGIFWKIVINFSFFGEEKIKNELEKSAKEVKIAFFSIKSILKLNKNGGSQNGISNNPSGLTIENVKNDIPNIAPNIAHNKSYNNPNSDLILIEDNNNINIKEKEKYKKENFSSKTILNSLEKFKYWWKWWDNNDDEEMDNWIKEKNVSTAVLNRNYESLINYCESKGKKYQNYKSALKNFILLDISGKWSQK